MSFFYKQKIVQELLLQGMIHEFIHRFRHEILLVVFFFEFLQDFLGKLVDSYKNSFSDLFSYYFMYSSFKSIVSKNPQRCKKKKNFRRNEWMLDRLPGEHSNVTFNIWVRFYNLMLFMVTLRQKMCHHHCGQIVQANQHYSTYCVVSPWPSFSSRTAEYYGFSESW